MVNLIPYKQLSERMFIMKSTYYTIFDQNRISAFIDRVHDIAHESVIGRRNRREAEPAILKAALYGGYCSAVGRCTPVWEKIPYITDKIKRGDIIYRFNGKNLGCSRFCDYRQILDCVAVDHVTKSSVIGTCGERVRPEQIICVCRVGIERSASK
jgi:hypothetical protein